MSIATVEHDAQFRKDLLDKLLCKKVTYQDVKRHRLSQREMEYLHLYDILDRREYVRLVMQGGYSKQAAYNKWRRVVKEIIKDFDPKPHANLIALIKKNGEDPSVLEMWLTARCKGGIPVMDILTFRDYIVDFLGRVRDDLYEKNTCFTREAAKKLGMSRRQIQRLAKDGGLQKKNRGLFPVEQVVGYQERKDLYLRQPVIKTIDSCIEKIQESINSIGFSVELQRSLEKLTRFIKVVSVQVDRKAT
ncbi:MAG TPA: hypothetical protein DDW94_11220 [Deltaproteobacteria bacterium]|nr:MAG: hypothetical protein A2Z79_04780 [Deltaproteobacteria bacterium GWA2_55_82]OGQ63897.1 MAG: hypothetical protein A3I81_12880 [Deltaproteobacteria bacterium RIFCSPLOWO2_02_FULL_55_12]OIJ72640.1 MAG: hypothetical protein A2V21_312350 [Deltaproteobacteria bacterium GWC2_55_46]HBG47541.1 hypothetical protein [Deltaproteobacteria bacterium]HCY10452.1 hypothetical protein [Deltaproteobacteria bacterium]